MIGKHRSAVRWLLGVMVALAVSGPSGAWIQPDRPERVQTQGPSWPQAASDVAADPEFRFGVLPNGMRYAVRRQAVPPGKAALRLHVSAGSLNEAEGQQGFAHFVEHMAFNGSTGVPEGEMIRILERLGLAFGPDTNASTGFDETLYRLDLPRTDRETLETGLRLLREVAGELTFSEAAVERERGVVLSEERSRDGPALRAARAAYALQFQDQLPPRRFPIGEVGALKAADRAGLMSFYHAWYRPETTVLVAVGDFDPEVIEARIRETFSDWRSVGPAGRAPDLGQVARRGLEARIHVDPGLPAALSVAWTAAPDLAADSKAKRRADLQRSLVLAILNQRLSDLARSEAPPFLGAGASLTEPFRAQRQASIYALASGADWRGALSAVLDEQRRLEAFGVRQDEVDRIMADLRANLLAARAGSATRTPSALAAEVTGSITSRTVVTSPEQDLERFERFARTLTLEDLNQAAARLFRGSGPLVFMTSPSPVEGAEAAVLSVARDRMRARVSARAPEASATWPYSSFGGPSGIAERRDLPDLDAVLVRFDNGVRLTVKPTRFKADQILVRVNVGGGRLNLPSDRPSPEWAAGALIEGGTGKMSTRMMEKALAGQVYSTGFGLTDDAFVLSGATRPADLDTQLQVLAAYVSDPGWRPEAFERYAALGASLHDQLAATGAGVLRRDLSALIRSGDSRWALPSREALSVARLEDLRSVLGPALASAPLEVVVVGATTVEKAIDAMSRTFGALPPRALAGPPVADQIRVRPPSGGGEAVKRTHRGREDQALLFAAWPTPGFFQDPKGARANRLLAEILGLRLTEELRERQGATYSPSTDSTQSLVLPEWGYISATVEIPPDQIEAVTRTIRRIAADLAASPPTADEMVRARKPMLEGLLQARETNSYWLSALSGVQADSRQLDALRSLIPTLEGLTPADLNSAARRWMGEERLWRLEIRPEVAAAAQGR